MSITATPTLETHGIPSRAPATPRSEGLTLTLLACGVVSSLYHIGVDIYVPMQWEGYSLASQVVSELSAVDAPTRPLWVTLLVPYTILVIAFGFGVLLASGGSRALRAAGALFVVNGVLGHFWPPMHLRGVEPTLTDTLHIAWSMAWLLVMLTVMGLAAAALGKRFRIYTLTTLAVFVVFGALTSAGGFDLAANRPTPWIGLWERINMGAGFLWIAVLAVALLRRTTSRETVP